MKNSLKDALILIADCAQPNLDLLTSTLHEQGATILCARDGLEAFDIVKKRAREIDLMVFDVRMPGMDGVKFTDSVRAIQAMRQIPIILINDDSEDDELVELGIEAGANDYLHKPIVPRELLIRSRSMIKQKRLMESNFEQQRSMDLEVVERNIKWLREVEMHRDAALYMAAKIAENRDPETGSHLERIRLYTKELAIGLSRKERYRGIIDHSFIINIEGASPLHDIGKVGIIDDILLKPGRLTPEEFEVMKTHTVIGGKILEETNEIMKIRSEIHGNLLEDAMEFQKFCTDDERNIIDDSDSEDKGNPLISMARDIALWHHERWDGTGYPHGLKGEETPFPARIMALADVYDALVSKRVYKEPVEHQEVVDIILESSGTHFDPAIVEVFAEYAERFSDIKEKIKEQFQEQL